MLSAVDTSSLASALSGELFHPGDAGWDEARRAWNLAVDQRPELVAFPETPEDVAAVVGFASERGLSVAPQGTGHAAGAHATLEGTILLQTARMRRVELDPEAGTARVQAGALSAELAGPASEHGLSGLGGSSQDVGVVGYTIGGGIGWLARRHGLACNRITAAELVTADGQLRRVDAAKHPDLFWAIRGGGGAFGVVCSLDLSLVEVPELYGGMVAWDAEAGPDLIAAFREWSSTAPKEVTTSFRFLHLPPFPDIPEPVRGRRTVALTAGFLGTAEEGREVLAPLIGVAEPVLDGMGPIPPAALGEIHGDPPQPVPGVADSVVLGSLGSDTIDTLLGLAGPGADNPLLAVELRHLGGALAEPAEDGGALDSIDGEYALGFVGMAPDPEAAQVIREFQVGLREAVAPWTHDRSYLNFAESVTDTATGFSFEAYKRLQEIKASYDPTDVIRSDHPIPPAG